MSEWIVIVRKIEHEKLQFVVIIYFHGFLLELCREFGNG